MSDAEAPGFAIPRVLRDGRYAVGRILGQGGMAVVCQAHDNELGVDRAVKLLMPRGGHRDTLRRRLRAEARAMARLKHPNILSVHDVGSEGELDYVVMDLAEGGSLQDLVLRGPLAPAFAVHHMVHVLSALGAAHAAGMVHRDVKPHNVLLDRHGRALLADFGIALLAGDDRRTRSGVAMGSLAFMPPEQRLDASRVGPTADLYAAGSTLYNLLTASNPVDLFLAGPESPRWFGVPPELAAVLRRACAMLPEERFADAASMESALMDLLPRMETLPVPGGNTTLPISDTALSDVQDGPRPWGVSFDRSPTRETPALKLDTPVPGTPPVPATTGFAEIDARPDRRPAALAGALLLALLALLGLLVWNAVGGLGGLGGLGGAAEPVQVAARGAAEPAPAKDPTPSAPAVAGTLTEAVAPEPPTPHEATPVAPVAVMPVAPVAPAAPRGSGAEGLSSARPAPTPVAGGTADAHPPGSVAGRWTGSLNGIMVDVRLHGPDDAVRGTFTSTFGANTHSSDIAGALVDGRLELADLDPTLRTAARYILTLSEDQRSLRGDVVQNIGGIKPLALRRAP